MAPIGPDILPEEIEGGFALDDPNDETFGLTVRAKSPPAGEPGTDVGGSGSTASTVADEAADAGKWKAVEGETASESRVRAIAASRTHDGAEKDDAATAEEPAGEKKKRGIVGALLERLSSALYVLAAVAGLLLTIGVVVLIVYLRRNSEGEQASKKVVQFQPSPTDTMLQAPAPSPVPPPTMDTSHVQPAAPRDTAPPIDTSTHATAAPSPAAPPPSAAAPVPVPSAVPSTVPSTVPPTAHAQEHHAEPAPFKPRPVTGNFTIQVFASTDLLDAARRRETLIGRGIDARLEKAAINGRTWYRVRIGGFQTESEARAKAESLGLYGVWIQPLKQARR
jgi:DedD protein